MSARAVLALAASLAVAGCSLFGPARQDDRDPLSTTLARMVRSEMERASVPGVAVAVVEGDRVRWVEGFGIADTTLSTPVTPDTRFRIGSMSKLFTATEIVRRSARGEVDLDAPLSATWPGFATENRVDGVTARALLSHHAGLPANHLSGMWEDGTDGVSEVQAIVRDEPLLWPPQTRYEYSNLGYGVLGGWIAHRSGRPFAEAMRLDLLRPIGMTDAAFERDALLQPGDAQGHRKSRPLPAFGLRDESAGALLASADDMARFLRLVLADGRGLVPAAAFRQMFEPQFAGLPLDFGQRVGLGWMLSGVDVPGAGAIAWHTGQYPGYFAAVVVARERRLAAVVLANGEEARGFALQVAARAIALALDGRTAEAAKAARPPRRDKVRDDELAPLAGDYAVFGSKATIVPAGGRLRADVLGDKMELVPLVDGRFALQKRVLGWVGFDVPDLTVRFESVDGRRFAVLDGLPEPMAFERLDRKPVPPAWRARLGRYRSDDGDKALEFLSFELRVEAGTLVARVKTRSRVTGQDEAEGTVVLQPASDDVAIVPGGAAMEGGALHASPSDGEGALRYSGYLLRRIGN